MSHQFMGDASADAVEQEGVVGVFEDGAVTGFFDVLKIAVGPGVVGAFWTEGRITDLPGGLAELCAGW